MTKKIVCGTIACALLASWASAQESPQQLGPENVRLIASLDGSVLYKTYCAVCHGNSGKGGGPLAESLRIPPSDLTRIAARNKGEFPMARVEKVIAGDEEVTKGHGTRAMPVWGPIFSQIAWDQDLGRLRIRNLANYIKGLQTR